MSSSDDENNDIIEYFCDDYTDQNDYMTLYDIYLDVGKTYFITFEDWYDYLNNGDAFFSLEEDFGVTQC